MVLMLLSCSFIFFNVISTTGLFLSFYINIVVEKHWHVATRHFFCECLMQYPHLVSFFFLSFFFKQEQQTITMITFYKWQFCIFLVLPYSILYISLSVISK